MKALLSSVLTSQTPIPCTPSSTVDLESLYDKPPAVVEDLELARADIHASTVFLKEISRRIWRHKPERAHRP